MFLQLLATIPPPPLRDLEVGPLTLHVYGLIIGIAIVLAMTLAERLLRADGIDTERLNGVLLVAVIGGFVGARLYHVLSEPRRYLRDPDDIVQVWNGGLGIYGGVFLGALTAFLVARRVGIPWRPLLDAGAPALLLAQALGRWGNYFNQELFGRPTGLPWALEVERDHRPASLVQYETFHPTFLYESLANLALLAVVLVLHRRWRGRAPGVLFPVYVAGYSLIRFFVESLRVDEAHVWLGMRQNQWVALALFVLAASIAAIVQQHHANTRTRASTDEPQAPGTADPDGPGA